MIFLKKYGVEKCKIELVKEFPCSNKWELEKEEGQIIRETPCVNKNIMGRSDKEYRQAYLETNKERIRQKEKEYYEANKERINQKQKEYREANKERINQMKKEYIHNNKELVYRKVVCEKCQKLVMYKHMGRHRATKKCLEAQAKQQEN